MFGGVLLLALTTRSLFAASPPPGVLLAVLAVASLAQIGLGVGLLQRSRAAWAFAMALYIVGCSVSFLAMPAILKAGIHPIVAGLAVAYPLAMVVVLSLTDFGTGSS
jgi:hypothetical protein